MTKINTDGSNISESIHPYLENMTIIMEIYKYFAKEMNVVTAYDLYQKVNSKILQQNGKKRYQISEMRSMYIVALQNLKYMGYFSVTR